MVLRAFCGAFITALAAMVSAFAADAPPAGLADCHDPWWIRSVYQPASFDCVEFGTREFDSNGTTYVVRAVKDRGTDTPEADDLAPLFLDAAMESMQAFAKLGLKIGHVSLVFYPGSDAVVEMGQGRETNAPVPQPMARASVFSTTECLMLLPLTGFTPEQIRELASELRFTAAHEAAHCVQEWNWPRQAIYLFAPGSWWAEGSADALASAAYPLERMTRAFIAEFDAHWSETPLVALAYETSPFFMWLWRERHEVFEKLIHCVTIGQPGIGSDMQADCLRATVDGATLAAFAAAYLDRTVLTLSGESAGVAPPAGARLEGEGTLSGDVPNFALWRAIVALPPGHWRVDMSEGGPAVAARRTGSEWKPVAEPGDIVIGCGADMEVPVFALPLTPAEGTFTLTVSRTGQADCGGG